uniref:DeoR family transcriptional regulator n=1 Tax=Thermogemmatispora argillosa TaxID=2045280 RepID=A0A455SZH2_9CHLR|nr:DeoR family transcriptional regulator [Thermogemmatispora argillosa]
MSTPDGEEPVSDRSWVLSEVRRKTIAEIVLQEGTVSTANLSRRLQVSEMTIRRDLKKLEELGILKRTFGGAIATGRSEDVAISQRAVQNREKKEAIARACAALVQPGEILLMDAGTTMAACAAALPEESGILVVTNGIMVVNSLLNKTGIQVYVLGGTLELAPQLITGISVIEKLRSLHADKAFITSSAMGEDGSISDANIHQSEIKRYMMQAASQKILAIDSSKIGHHSLNRFAHISDFDILVVDDQITPEHLARLGREAKRIIVAPVSSAAPPTSLAKRSPEAAEPGSASRRMPL